ncbi:MAG TPA: hypothetical protein VHO24_08225 [Opitutaceae bacterium]|nr:hypothetical protein [Opitutaceae bacterium]
MKIPSLLLIPLFAFGFFASPFAGDDEPAQKTAPSAREICAALGAAKASPTVRNSIEVHLTGRKRP